MSSRTFPGWTPWWAWTNKGGSMEYHILAVGDVVGEPGLKHLEKNLRPLKKLKNILLPS